MTSLSTLELDQIINIKTIYLDYGLGSPSDCTFDTEGNLWMSLISDDGGIALLEESVIKVYLKGLSSSGSSIVFDNQGSLWVGHRNITKNYLWELYKFSKNQQRSSSLDITIHDPIISSKYFDGSNFPFIFDKEGNLWVIANNLLLNYASEQLLTTSSQNPKKIINLKDYDETSKASALAFSPDP